MTNQNMGTDVFLPSDVGGCLPMVPPLPVDSETADPGNKVPTLPSLSPPGDAAKRAGWYPVLEPDPISLLLLSHFLLPFYIKESRT